MPTASGPDAPATAFSATRAIEHVHEIAREPRPSGSRAHTRTREYLVRTLTDLGASPRVHTTAAVTHMPELSPTGADSRFAGLELHNVVARIPGTSSTRPVALVTHYDSVESSPGANDAGVPVGVLLETARALLSGPPPRNDVLFIFTDAEEIGLLGAQALVNSPSILSPDTVVLNFEARGSRGPSVMFETGPDNAWLVELLTGQIPEARTGSLLNAAYAHLPNLTDFTVFRRAGHQGLNLAYLGGYTHYHGANDTPENVDPATVQHQGVQALGLARSLGTADLSLTPPGNSVYFEVAGWYARYPTAVEPAAALAVAGLGLVLLLRLRAREVLSLTGTVRGLAVCIGQLLITTGAAFVLAPLVASRHPEFAHYHDIADHGTAAAGFLLLAVALGTGFALLTHRWAGGRDQVAGAIALWTLLACASAVVLPGGSHIFTWSALGLIAAAAIMTSAVGRRPGARLPAAALGVLPLGLLVFPLIPLLTSALGLGLVAVPVAFVTLMTALLPGVVTPLPRLFPVVAGVLAAVVLTAGALLPPHTAHPSRADVMYLLDADQRTAHWLSGSPPDAWSGTFLPDGTEAAGVTDLWPGWRTPVQRGPATALPLAAPEVTTTVVREDSEEGRTVRVTATSRRGAGELVLIVTGASVRGYAITGVQGWHEDTPPGEAPWELWVRQVPEEGVELVMDLEPGPATLRVIDRTAGLPERWESPAAGPRAPALGISAFSDATLVATSRSLD
ncbi:M28 family peptidase [Streptomyces alkaliphilus]|nr:M28 family peptidase [Streptomyces alkaliphilus]